MLLTVFVSYVLFMIPALEEQLPKPIDHNAACVMVAVVLERCMVSQSQSVSQSVSQSGSQAVRQSGRQAVALHTPFRAGKKCRWHI